MNSSSTDQVDSPTPVSLPPVVLSDHPCTIKFGATAVRGRRRDMEDAVAIHPSFCQLNVQNSDMSRLHFFGLYDGHGCSHVAMSCKHRMHQLVKEELENRIESSSSIEWKEVMERSFSRMDEEVLLLTRRDIGTSTGPSTSTTTCNCKLEMPQCDEVGSTAIVSIITPDKIVVANCGDSRTVLCRRHGKAVPLSTDHKPNRPDELLRIQNAGGHVIDWDGAPRVQGSLAMSRAIGDNYLKPYVISEPEVTITERTDEDESLILASDGLWDMVSKETACGIASMCLNGEETTLPHSPSENPNKACSDATILLTKLTLARYSMDNISVVVVDLRRAI